MEIKRTANAGVLLKMDGQGILIDGVCGKFPPYQETPEKLKKELLKEIPDSLLITHTHPDHFDCAFSENFKKNFRTFISAEGKYFLKNGEVEISAVKTRHIGKSCGEHISFVIKGTKTIWFMGDASPNELVKLEGLTRPDVLIMPYAYVITPAALKMTEMVEAKLNVILHLPKREDDNLGLWDAVEKANFDKERFVIPDINSTIII